MIRLDETTLDRATTGFALGAALLSAVASRFGLWKGVPAAEAWSGFVSYTAEVVSFAPPSLVPPLAGLATLAEATLGILLLAGVRRAPVALASAALLASFGTAMAISLGPKEPLDDSVSSACGAALLLARRSDAARTV
jgi:hypothetical protein